MPYFPGPRSNQLPPQIAAMVTGWARVKPSLGWRRPGLPKDWCPILECDPEEPKRPPMPGWFYIWVENRVREVDGRALEVVTGAEPPA